MRRIVALQMIGDRNQIIPTLGIILAKLKGSRVGINRRSYNEKGVTSCRFKLESCVGNNIRITWGGESNHLVYADRQLRVSDIEILIRVR